ncbi:hypothetical protein [Leptothoe spongobia]|uniref:DUF2325 domain-containing protein n=1 Tax=Leptothoe spongobia TAU-MAC 1115 TaxID=1967444 RepID=A0A947GQJ2_9CYAN|nr:hypothetical protein [Leptothoe spongobia]MBT9317081.1 hypothetical protein [Leptothoe spongobia TAU-MAC 1115]
MKKAKHVIRPLTKPIRHVSNWCIHLWDGVSGKDHRRVHQLRHELAIAQENAANLTQQLAQAHTQYTDLQKAFNDQQQELDARQQALADHQQELENSRQQYSELWQELDAWVTDSDAQIQFLKRELRNRTSALTNCEANLNTVQQSNLAAIQARSTAPITNEPTTPVITLADWKIGFVGGHEATRRVVIQTLRSDYGLVYTAVEIPSHREVSTSQKQLKQKLADCDLIVSIVRYSNHSLTKSLMQLKEKGGLKGKILTPNSRGVSGVVRDILSFIETSTSLDTEEAG